MNVQFYVNNSDDRTLNKNITLVSGTDVVLKNDTDIMHPVIQLLPDKFPTNANYCYIEKFGRYYYINRQSILTGKLLEIRLDIDVLMSHSDIIKTSTVVAVKSTNKSNRYIGDSIPTLAKQNNIFKSFTPFQGALAFDSGQITAETPCILLTVLRG